MSFPRSRIQRCSRELQYRSRTNVKNFLWAHFLNWEFRYLSRSILLCLSFRPASIAFPMLILVTPRLSSPPRASAYFKIMYTSLFLNYWLSTRALGLETYLYSIVDTVAWCTVVVCVHGVFVIFENCKFAKAVITRPGISFSSASSYRRLTSNLPDFNVICLPLGFRIDTPNKRYSRAECARQGCAFPCEKTLAIPGNTVVVWAWDEVTIAVVGAVLMKTQNVRWDAACSFWKREY